MSETNNKFINLESTKCEKELCVYMDNDLMFRSHAEVVVNKANRIVGMITHTFTFMDCAMFRTSFSSLFRICKCYLGSLV